MMDPTDVTNDLFTYAEPDSTMTCLHIRSIADNHLIDST